MGLGIAGKVAQVAALITYLSSVRAAASSGGSIPVGHRVLGVQ